jgi:hypothetical protein
VTAVDIPFVSPVLAMRLGLEMEFRALFGGAAPKKCSKDVYSLAERQEQGNKGTKRQGTRDRGNTGTGRQ